MRHNELMRCEQPSGAWALMIASMLLSVCPLAGCMTDGTVYRNFTPEANAGEDQQVDFPGSPVQITLNGSGSTDTDGSIAKYIWRPGFLGPATDAGAPQLGGPDPEDRANPTVMLGEGVWEFVLWVEDNDGAVSDPDVVTITVGEPAMAECPPYSGMVMGMAVDLPGCCAPEGKCGVLSSVSMMCITTSTILTDLMPGDDCTP